MPATQAHPSFSGQTFRPLDAHSSHTTCHDSTYLQVPIKGKNKQTKESLSSGKPQHLCDQESKGWLSLT